MSDNIYAKLMAIQAELNVPKSRVNKFSNFNFRNAEDILAAAKPICHRHKCVLTLTDSIKLIGERYYIEALAKLHDCESVAEISVSAFAREDATKKGFDSAQITGAASSYARKYALNGLFNLDDANDPDNGVANIICPVCGDAVDGITGKDGVWRSPSDVLNQCGMCVKCYQNRKK